MSKKIFVLDKDLDLSEVKKSNHCYIIAKNGVFFKDNQHNIETCTKIDSIEGLSSLQPYIKWRFPKITKRQFNMVIQFFRKVYTKHKSECMVLIGWDRKKKDIILFAPDSQEVSGASIKYQMTNIPGVALIGSIHSHASMSAFHSGVDIADEMNFDGLHITIGKFSDKTNTFQISSQLTSGKMRETIDHTQIIEDIYINYNVKLEGKGLKDCSNDSIIEAIMNNKCDIKYDGEMCIDEKELDKEDKEIIESWLETVVPPRTYIYGKNWHSGYGYNKQQSFTPIKKDVPAVEHPIGSNDSLLQVQDEIDLATMYGVEELDELLIDDNYDLDIMDNANIFNKGNKNNASKVEM